MKRYISKVNKALLNNMRSIKASIKNRHYYKVKSNLESEIQEQPDIIAKLIDKYIAPDNYVLMNIPLNIDKVVLIASGSSFNCAYIAAEMLKETAHCEAECIYASEFKMNECIKKETNTLFIFISQSGETSDTLSALKQISQYTDKTLCITNNEDSSMWVDSNYKISILAGKENSIASTKALSAQLYCLALVVLKIMQSKNIDFTQYLEELKTIPATISEAIANKAQINKIAKNLSKFKSISVIGSRKYYGLAKEGALKIKETSYINTTAYPQGEFMHGHVAILNQKAAIISVFDNTEEKANIRNLQKIKEKYSAYILTISNVKDNAELQNTTNRNIVIDTDNTINNIFGTLVTLQIMALETAKKLKRNLDNPKGLTKVVTD